MLVSLIMPTLNRFDDIYRFMDSLLEQTYKNFELIVVDQNDNDKVKEIVDKYVDRLDIKYIKSNKKGLSYNRNLGIDVAKGEVLAFPDDDCAYKPDTIEKAINFFEKNQDYKIYSCKTLDFDEKEGFIKMNDGICEIESTNISFTVCSITFFVNFGSDDSYTRFDERLGVGAEFGAGEETDYVLDLLSRGFKGRYFGDDIIHHPVKKHSKSSAKYERDFNYGRGFGALCKKEIVYRKNYKFIKIIAYKLIRNIGGIILNKDRDYHEATIKGRIEGFRQYKM